MSNALTTSIVQFGAPQVVRELRTSLNFLSPSNAMDVVDVHVTSPGMGASLTLGAVA